MIFSERLAPVASAIGKRPYAFASVIVISIMLGGLFATGIVRVPRLAPAMDFALRQKVSAASVLRMSFPELMDHGSVEKNLILPEDLKGSLTWQDEVLTFTPAEKLPAGKALIFRVGRNALTSDQVKMGKDLEFTFTVAGPPKIAVRIPEASAQNVAAGTIITMVFDRPMIPLTQVQGDVAAVRMANFPARIVPEVKGRWRWLSTVAVQYIPEKELDASTHYTVSVPKGISTVSGDATEEDFSWTFETARPEVVSTEPNAGYALAGPSTTIALTFNQAMNPATALPFLKLEKGISGSGSTPVDIRSVAFAKTKDTNNPVAISNMLVLSLTRPLEFASSYTLTIAPGIKGAHGNLGSQSGYTLNFSTVGTLAVQRAVQEYGRIAITFNNPLTEKSSIGKISVTPSVKGWNDLEWSLSSWDDSRELSVYPELSASTKYTITVADSLTDAYGQKLKEPFAFSFETPPLPPQLQLDSKGDFGIFERSKPPVYRLQSVNTTGVEAELASISFADFLAFRGSNQYSWNELPAKKTPVAQWTMEQKSKRNTWESSLIDLTKQAGQSLGSGIYGISVRAPHELGYDGLPLRHTQLFVLTNMALTLKYSGNRVLVWAIDMQTGEPISGAQLAFHALSGQQVLTGKTDKEGFFESAVESTKFVTPGNEWNPEFWVTAEKGGDFALVSSRWSDGLSADAFGYMTDFWNPQERDVRVHSYLYTDRPLYRAGDTVYFKGLARLRDRNGALSLPGKDRTINLNVADATGNQILQKSLPFSTFGSFADSFPIDTGAPLGTYVISAGFADSPYPEIYGYFEVLTYRKPEYRVDLTTKREEYFENDTVQATIEGAYYFGAPMAGAAVTWRAQTTDYFFNKVTDGWYSFGTEDAWCWYNCERETKQLSEGSGTLDAMGHLTVSVPANIAEKAMSQILTIEADITDPNNQVVSNRVSVPVHKADVYVGVRTEDYVVTTGQDATIAVITVKPDGSPLPSTSVTLQLYKRTWTTVKEKGVDGEYYYNNTPEDTFIRSIKVTTDEKGKASGNVRPDQGGEYRVVAVAEDQAGRQSKAATSLYAYSSSYVNWPRSNNDRIDILADKPEYKIGDTATILIKSPYQGKGVKALVTIEREQVIRKQVIAIESAAQALQIPITEDLLPNAYVSVVIIKPRIGETFDENGLDTGVPAFKIGYAKISVENSRKRIAVTVQTDKPQYLPGEKVEVTLAATDWQGKPVRAELSLGVVDMSLLALSGFSLPDPVAQFYSDRPTGVFTAEMLKYLIDRYKPGSKGGGGAELEAKRRGNFKDTAYWNPAILTDENGKATVTFTLPDNLTTWHFLGIGQTKENTFGAAAVTAVETKRVILRPVRPRFGVVGDRITLGAIVHNFLDAPATFSVSLTGSGFTVIGKNTQEVTVQKSSLQKVSFPVTLKRTEQASFTFLAKSGEFRDEVEEKIPVFIYGTPQSAATTGVTESKTEEKVLVPTERDAKDGNLTVTVSPSLATYLPLGLAYLMRFPYGCAEQTLSAVLPSIALTRLQQYDAFQIVDRKALEANVTRGLERLSSFQRGDGGFGYWQESNKSYPYLSAYVLYAFHLMQQSGFALDSAMIGRTQEYLNSVLRSSDPRDRVDQASRAFILFVLTETGEKDISLLKNLDADREKLPLFAKAHLAMAFEKSGSHRKALDIVEEIVRTAKVDSRGTHFEEEESSTYASLMHTNDRTSAIVLQAMIRIDPGNSLLPNMVRYLLAVRKDGHWDTTQSTTYALLALVDYLEETKEMDASYSATTNVNGAEVMNWSITKANVLTRRQVSLALNEMKRGEENSVQLTKIGKGKLYYDLLLSYFYTADDLPPAEEGISILRSVEPMPGQDGTSLRVGNTYRVTLTITVPEDRHFVAVESPFPAGMEAIDLSLETAQKTLLTDDTTKGWSEDYWQSGLWRFTHREYRDDAFFAFADELPAGVYQLTYLTRATTPGTFHERPARAWEMYFPETFGQTAGKLVTIGE